MYLVKLFNPEYGDMDDAVPAESLDDAVGAALKAVGKSSGHRVVAEMCDGSMNVQIMRGDLVLASIEDVEVAMPAEGAVVDAVNEAMDGHMGALQALFGDPAGGDGVAAGGTQTAPEGWVADGHGNWRREHPILDLLIGKKDDSYQVFIHDRHEATRSTLEGAAQFVDDVLAGRFKKEPIVG